MSVNVSEFGAMGDGVTNATPQLQAAIDAAGRGGGTVIVSAGAYVTGTLWMRSNVTLHLEAGNFAGQSECRRFPDLVERLGRAGREQIARGDDLWRRFGECGDYRPRHHRRPRADVVAKPAARARQAGRPLLCRLIDCRNVLIEGVTFRNSPMWTVSPLACDNVIIRGITMLNPHDSPNTDGINPDSCRNVRICDCHVDVGDDCITIKCGKKTTAGENRCACENITITNCTHASWPRRRGDRQRNQRIGPQHRDLQLRFRRHRSRHPNQSGGWARWRLLKMFGRLISSWTACSARSS